MNDNKKETIGNDLENFIKEKKNGEVLYLDDDTARFMLGEVGENPIICFGINPSTANDEKDDPTISKIRKIASENTKLQDLYFSLDGKVLCSKDWKNYGA